MSYKLLIFFVIIGAFWFIYLQYQLSEKVAWEQCIFKYGDHGFLPANEIALTCRALYPIGYNAWSKEFYPVK